LRLNEHPVAKISAESVRTKLLPVLEVLVLAAPPWNGPSKTFCLHQPICWEWNRCRTRLSATSWCVFHPMVWTGSLRGQCRFCFSAVQSVFLESVSSLSGLMNLPCNTSSVTIQCLYDNTVSLRQHSVFMITVSLWQHSVYTASQCFYDSTVSLWQHRVFM